MAAERPAVFKVSFADGSHPTSPRIDTEPSRVRYQPSRQRPERRSLLVDAIRNQPPLGDTSESQYRKISEARKVMDILRGTPAETKKSNVTLLAIGPTDANGSLLFENSLYVLCILNKLSETSVFVQKVTRDVLLRVARPGEDVDALVRQHSAVRSETDFERYRRLQHEIILLEMRSGRARTEPSDDPKQKAIDQFNQKIDRVLDLLETSERIESANGHLGGIFDCEDRENEGKLVVTMFYVREGVASEAERLLDSQKPVVLKMEEGSREIQIVKEKLLKRRARYEAGSEDPYDKIASELCDFLDVTE